MLCYNRTTVLYITPYINGQKITTNVSCGIKLTSIFIINFVPFTYRDVPRVRIVVAARHKVELRKPF